MADVRVRAAESPDDIVIVQQLWREYWESFQLPPNFQGFAEELRGLPGAYGAHGGVLLVAFLQDEPAGTMALRRLDQTSGEAKRLFVRPKFRGQGLGRRLVETVIERAIAVPYDCLYGDTLPNMIDALKLYERLGFERAEPYSSTPTIGAIFLKLNLVRRISNLA